MKVLLVGNLGYVGPVLMEYLSSKKVKYDGIDISPEEYKPGIFEKFLI